MTTTEVLAILLVEMGETRGQKDLPDEKPCHRYHIYLAIKRVFPFVE